MNRRQFIIGAAVAPVAAQVTRKPLAPPPGWAESTTVWATSPDTPRDWRPRRIAALYINGRRYDRPAGDGPWLEWQAANTEPGV